MVLPSSGLIRASDINVELGRLAGAPFDINNAVERALAGKPTGAIKFSDFYGKSNKLREPATGDLYSASAPTYQWRARANGSSLVLYWNGATIIGLPNSVPNTQLTFQSGGWIYNRGVLKVSSGLDRIYAVWRIQA